MNLGIREKTIFPHNQNRSGTYINILREAENGDQISETNGNWGEVSE